MVSIKMRQDLNFTKKLLACTIKTQQRNKPGTEVTSNAHQSSPEIGGYCD